MNRQDINLVQPSIQYKTSYISLIKEFHDKNEPLIPFPLKMSTADFPALISALTGFEKGINLSPGFVPHSTYWLVEGEQVLAVSNLRHRLNNRLMKEGGHIGYGVRPSCRNMGYATCLLAETIKKAVNKNIFSILITCDKNNIASSRVIRKNGGRLENEIFSPVHNGLIQRYWIHIDR